MTTQSCTCPAPFTEDDVMCLTCEQAWIDGLTQIDEDKIPTGTAWNEYARRQG